MALRIWATVRWATFEALIEEFRIITVEARASPELRKMPRPNGMRLSRYDPRSGGIDRARTSVLQHSGNSASCRMDKFFRTQHAAGICPLRLGYRRGMRTKNTPILKSALRAAGRGWPVFPVHGIADGDCTCGNPDCAHPGKHPITKHGVKDATTDELTIRRWFSKHPNANFGIATGAKSGLLVLDIDADRGGLDSIKEFERENGRLPEGPVLMTGGGGVHLYLRHAQAIKNRVNVLPGIDVRGEGGYVLGPNSLHKSGKTYLWTHTHMPEKVQLPEPPDSLLKLLARKTVHTAPPDIIPHSQRNSTLASMAGSMRRRSMTRESIMVALLEENRLRCEPPLSKKEVLSIARSISNYPPGTSSIPSDGDDGADFDPEIDNLPFRTGEQIADEVPSAIPWIAGPYVTAGTITEVDGKVKLAGKTTWVTHLVSAVLDGRLFLGKPTTKTPVVYLTEQPVVSFREAMARAGLLGRKDFTVLFWHRTIGIPWTSVARAAAAECKRIGAKLLVVDTLSQFAGLVGDSENNAGDALKALRPLRRAIDEGIGVIITRHERKSGGAVGDSARGSSAIGGGVDTIVSIRRPEGKSRNVRELQMISRMGDTADQLIELTEEGYHSLGAPGEAAKNQAANELLGLLPKSKKKATTIAELVAKTGKPRARLQQILDALTEDGQVLISGNGRKGSPYRFYTG